MPPVPADRQRAYQLYQYLCSCLAIAQSNDGTPNFTGIGSRLSEAKDFRRVVSLVFKGEEAWLEKAADSRRASNLTTGEVVKMMAQLDTALKEDYRTYEEPYSRVLTISDILMAFHKLVELTPEERQDLGLPVGDGLTLLQRALLILQVIGGTEDYEMLFRIYKAAVGLDFANTESSLSSLAEVDDLITRTVEQTLNYLPHRLKRSSGAGSTFDGREETVLKLTQKAQREIRRLLVRSGNQRNQVVDNVVIDSYIQHYLQPAFVTKLATTVVANERLTDQFPVYLKRISIETSGPLPFADQELGVLQADGPYPALLHPALRRLKPERDLGQREDLPGPGDYELASQEANRVTAEFYIKVPEDYVPAVPEVFQKLASENHKRIDFALSSTGIGGTLSHVIKVINQALLSDLPCLREYFGIAHDVTSTQTIIRENVASPIWAHSLVKLCKKRTVGQTVQFCGEQELRSYEEFAFADPIGHGDYCGFDFVIAQAQAALQARLQAVRNTGVAPQEYIRDLCHHTEKTIALENAWSYLRGYPFSSFAMVGAIRRKILQPSIGDRALQKTDPYIYFDACLSIVEVLINEGAYRSAKRYLERLDILDEYVQQGLQNASQMAAAGSPQFEVFSGGLIVRYLLCQANYLYMYDPSDHDPRYLPSGCDSDINREGLVQRAWTVLDQAQQHVSLRLRKYVVINEVSQGTFYPHYTLLARIAFLRVKLLIFFARFVPKDEKYLLTEQFSGQRRIEASVHWGRLFLAEKARLYAAAEGNSEVYACYAAIQSWLHMIAAHTSDENLTLSIFDRAERNPRGQTLAPSQCLEWARKLRDHALISYAETGRYCYNQIKEKSGLSSQSDTFGPYNIQTLPAIYEARHNHHADWSQARDNNFLVLDMSLLSVNVDDLQKLSPRHPARNIYLFGTGACYLFFARGMYLLCSNASEEFEPSASEDSEIQWHSKLQQATRLLNMAWAIAEDGCDLIRADIDGNLRFDIRRSWARPEPQNEYYSTPEVDSVRDLYPRRVTEMINLSKIFAAASMVLRLPLLPLSDRTQLAQDVIQFLEGPRNERLGRNRTVKALLARQKDYNGHLSAYSEQAKNILIERIESVMNTEAVLADPQAERDQLLRALFEALL